MKRHSSLVPLSHDHHHALVEARRLRRAAEADEGARLTAATSFLRFFSMETVRHFREEEELLFPALVNANGAGEELLVRALLEHQRLHAAVGRLERDLTAGRADASAMRALGELLEAHVRLEERELFPLLEQVVPRERLAVLDLAAAREQARTPVVDLSAPRGSGPLWGAETEDLNATLLAWPARGGPGAHVNNERDVILVVLAGSATVTIDGAQHALHAAEAVIVEKGRSRTVAAGPDGVRYLSVHLRRPPLRIAARGRSA